MASPVGPKPDNWEQQCRTTVLFSHVFSTLVKALGCGRKAGDLGDHSLQALP